MTHFGDYYGATERTENEFEEKLAHYLFFFNTLENEAFSEVFFACMSISRWLFNDAASIKSI
jgi:hypothetical protein